jgi:hypothetical protein
MRRIDLSSLRLTLALLVALIGAQACGPASSDDQRVSSSALSQGGTLWPSGVVPVCYSTADGNNQTLLSRAKSDLTTIGWEAIANVRYTGWGPCGSSGPPTGAVRVHFKHGSNGLTSILGYPGGGNFTDVTLVDDDTTGNHFQYEVLHEFGHAIGWEHEQQRPDNYGSSGYVYCSQVQRGQGEDTHALVRTPYFDRQSIMSYCTGWPQNLSPGDVAGAQIAYGKKYEVVNGQNGSNSAVSRKLDNLDVFFVHKDGSVWTSWWHDGLLDSNWATFQISGAGAGTAPSNAPVASVSRASGNIDTFYAGNADEVVTSFWSDGNGYATDTVPGTQLLAAPGEQIAAVSSSPGAIDLFFSGTGDKLYWSHFSAQCGSGPGSQCGWNNPVAVVSDGTVPFGSAVSAVARTPDRLEAFYIGTDRALHMSECYGFGKSGSGSCSKGNFNSSVITTPSECYAPKGAGIAATARTQDNIDVFFVSSESRLCHSSWTSGSGWTTKSIGEQNVVAGGSLLSAVARSEDNLDVFFMGGGGSYYSIYGAWWQSGASWTMGYVASTYGSLGIPESPLGAVSREPTKLDVFAPGMLLFGGPLPKTVTWASWQIPYWPDLSATESAGWKTHEVDAY